jgi:hypothetical protein
MKKLLPLLLLLLIFNSCSVSDKEPGEEIIGHWTLIQMNDTAVYDPDACFENTRISIQEENLITTTYFDPTADCLEKTSEGYWEFLGESEDESIYILEIFPEYGELEGRINFESVHVFNFYTRINDQLVIFTFERS